MEGVGLVQVGCVGLFVASVSATAAFLYKHARAHAAEERARALELMAEEEILTLRAEVMQALNHGNKKKGRTGSPGQMLKAEYTRVEENARLDRIERAKRLVGAADESCEDSLLDIEAAMGGLGDDEFQKQPRSSAVEQELLSLERISLEHLKEFSMPSDISVCGRRPQQVIGQFVPATPSSTIESCSTSQSSGAGNALLNHYSRPGENQRCYGVRLPERHRKNSAAARLQSSGPTFCC